MSGLVEFLRDRLDEEDAAAQLCTPGPWRWREVERHDDPAELVGEDDMRVLYAVGFEEPDIEVSELDAEHIARHDPVRARAEVAAKRALLAEVESWQHRANSDAWVFCPMSPETRRRFPDDWDDDGERCTCGRDVRAARILQPLSAVYAAHPDYDKEWTP